MKDKYVIRLEKKIKGLIEARQSLQDELDQEKEAHERTREKLSFLKQESSYWMMENYNQCFEDDDIPVTRDIFQDRSSQNPRWNERSWDTPGVIESTYLGRDE